MEFDISKCLQKCEAETRMTNSGMNVTHQDRVRYAARRLEDMLAIYDDSLPQSVVVAMGLAIERIRQLENDIEFLQSSW